MSSSLSFRRGVGFKLFLAFSFNAVLIVVVLIILAAIGSEVASRQRFEGMDRDFAENLARSAEDRYRREGSLETLRQGIEVLFPGYIRPGEAAFDNSHFAPPEPKPRPMPRIGDIMQMVKERITVLDKNGNRITGPKLEKDPLYHRELQVDGQIIGTLILKQLPFVPNPFIWEFINNQGKIVISVSAAILLLSSIISYFFSRRLLAPLPEINSALNEIAHQNLDIRITKTMHDEFGELAAQFNAMAEKLSRYEQMRKQWIADISHELRTPLSFMLANIEAMQDGIRPIDRKSVNKMHVEIKHLSKLVNRLHELAAADRSAIMINLEKVRPVLLLERILSSVSNRLQAADLSLSLDAGLAREAVIMGDPFLLEQIFYNVLDNSIKYTDSPGRIAIECMTTGNEFVLSFSDSAPGISPEAIGRIFDRLFRVDNARAGRVVSSGLGLSICKSYVEAQNGKISARQASLGGIAIDISFPLIKE